MRRQQPNGRGRKAEPWGAGADLMRLVILNLRSGSFAELRGQANVPAHDWPREPGQTVSPGVRRGRWGDLCGWRPQTARPMALRGGRCPRIFRSPGGSCPSSP